MLPDGRAVAVTGSDDATVRVWDLAAGTPIGAPLTGHTSTVGAVATAGAARRPAHRRHRQRRRHGAGLGPGRRHPASAHPSPATPARWERWRPLVQPDGRVVAVTGSADATVRVWDLATGTPVGAPLTGHTGWVQRGGLRDPA